MTGKDLTVRELYELLESLLEEYGELEVGVSYDSGVVVTPLKDKLPFIDIMRSRIILEGY